MNDKTRTATHLCLRIKFWSTRYVRYNISETIFKVREVSGGAVLIAMVYLKYVGDSLEAFAANVFMQN